jgi:SAM-dependent methyltransferase
VSFDVAAEAYDRYMGRWSRLLAPHMAAFADVREGQRVLDVGCGPGALTTELVTRLGGRSVTAVDPSAPFVEAARERHPDVDVRQASAEDLPFDDRAFDAALAQLVVHFMPDPVAGLAEMRRVTEPGGVVAACVWDYAGGQDPLGPFWAVAREIDPDVEDESDLPGTRAGHLSSLMATAGLREIDETEFWVGREFADFDDWWTPFLHGVGPGGVYVGRLAPDRQLDLQERCRARLPEGTFTLRARAWAARGIA